MMKIYSKSFRKNLFSGFLALFLMLLSSTAFAGIDERNAELTPPPLAQQKSISGTIIDQSGLPVVGARALVKGTTNAAISDATGSFVLDNVSSNDVIVISFMGFVTREVVVLNQTKLSIILKEDAYAIDDVIVVGYGTSKKSNLTGSVATVGSKALENRPIQSVSQALQGQVAGVVVIQNSGRPGSQTGSVTIRGKNTINAGGPLVIIDGIPGNMNNIDPGDVDNISILKDAASSAIYGVQAANGVILITTKKGSLNGGTKVSYNGSYTLTTPTVIPDYLGSYDYAVLYNESQRNQNPKITDAQYRFKPDDLQKFKDGSSPLTHPDTDWYSEVFKKVTAETQHHMSINGGNASTSYNGSFGFLNMEGKSNNNDYKRYNMRFNVETQATKWFQIGLNLAGSLANNKMGWDSPESLAQFSNRIPPTNPVYLENGDYAYAGMDNPVAAMNLGGDRKYRNTEYNARLSGKINILPNLSVSGIYAYRGINNNNTGFARSYSYGEPGALRNPKDREGYNNNTNYFNETIQLLADYTESFGKHSIALFGGYEQVSGTYRESEAKRTGGGNNDLSESLNTMDPTKQFANSKGYDVSRMSFLGRFKYSYDDKYLFEANFRADASSRFPKDNRWGYFPAFSAGWRISEENFMKEVSWLSNLKLRLGYGITGNEELDGNYEGVDAYKYGSYIFGDEVYSTALEARYVNHQLHWAEVANYEVAIESGFLNNMLGFELSLYKKVTSNMLLRLPNPGILGADSPLQNAGSVENTGFDLGIFHNHRIGQVAYNINLNLGYSKNKITDLKETSGQNPKNTRYWFIEGESIGSFYGYKAVGLFRDADDVKNSAKLTGKELPGDIKYEDIDGDGKITGKDRQVIGVDYPKWMMGLNIGATWKNWDLSLFFQGAFDVDAYWDNEMSYAFFNSGKVLNRHLDRWTPENLDASYPRITNSFQGNFGQSSYWIQNVSYLRLKNLTFGYTLPESVVSKIGLSRVKVYFSGENLLTFTDVKDWDPESASTSRGAIYNNLKKYSFGLRLTF